jgi:hypothetical protein
MEYSFLFLLSQHSQSPQFAGRISCINAWLRNIFGYDRTRANHDVVCDLDWHDRRVRADRDVISDRRRSPKAPVAASRTSDSERVIDEHHPMGNKAMISDLDQLANERMGLDLTIPPDFNAFLDLHERSDACVIADKALIQVDGFDNDDILAEDNIPDAALFQDGIVCHEFTLVEITATGPGSGFG